MTTPGGSEPLREGHSASEFSGTGVPDTFDLSTVEPAYYARQSSTRRRALGSAIVGTIVPILFLAEAASLPVGSTGFLLLVFGAVVTAALVWALLRVAIRLSGHGPSRVTVTASALELSFPGGTTQAIAWTNPLLRLRIEDYRAIDLPVRRILPCEAFIGNRQFALSPEAADAILRTARSQAGAVFSRALPGASGREAHLWDIRGRPTRDAPRGWTRVT
jgi:hypothetical protein